MANASDLKVQVNLSDPLDTAPVALRDASGVGQFCLSSSAGSRYVCVVHSTRLNMAARIIGARLSVRVESSSPASNLLEPDQLNLKEMGFTINAAGAYASVHFDHVEERMAFMALASLIAGVRHTLGPAPAESMAMADLLKLKGSGA